jgi:tetratricopeptide (TPR) repeat protein
MPKPDFVFGSPEDFDEFLHTVVRAVVHEQSIHDILVFASEQGPEVMCQASPTTPPESDGPAASPMQCRQLVRNLIDQVPRPALRFAVRHEPRPAPGAPCDCGSGLSSEHCCANSALANATPALVNLLPLVLDCLPRRRWSELAHSAIEPAQVAETASEFVHAGRALDAIALLAPWFERKRIIPDQHAALLETLLHAYEVEGTPPNKLRNLLDRALKLGESAVRSCAHRHMALMASDLGNHDKAWRHFLDAQRESPDAPELADAEIMLLFSAGKEQHARERAAFWTERLGQDPTRHGKRLRFLHDFAERGGEAVRSLMERGESEESVDILFEMLDAAPAPAVCYRLPHATDADSGELEPAPPLAKALRAWQAHFPQEHPGLTATAVENHPGFLQFDAWLDLLDEYPVLWQSLEVLDDLTLALNSLSDTDNAYPLRMELLERAQQLLELNLQANHAVDKTLEWGFHGNRPALRLLAQLIFDDEDKPCSAETLALIERMLALNPSDNHGMRVLAMGNYLMQDRFDSAIALAERYPGDVHPDILFGNILALYAGGQHDQARSALRHAHSFLPGIVPMLLAEKPRRPRNEAGKGFMAHDSLYQAWHYRRDYLALWQRQPGALEWLREQAC